MFWFLTLLKTKELVCWQLLTTMVINSISSRREDVIIDDPHQLALGF